MASRRFAPAMRCRPLMFVCLALLLGLAWLGCSKRTTAIATATRQGALLLGNGAEPADLDPPAVTAATDMNIINALFEGLTFIDEQSGHAVPAAAETWDSSPDGLTWTFHLRSSASWSNGDPLVADDFVQSFRRVVSPRLAFENASYLFALKNAQAINRGQNADLTTLGCSAPDAHTLVLTLERPTPQLPLLTALTPWFPINPRVLQTFGAMTTRGTPWTRPGNLVGNGAFTLQEWAPNSRIVVAKNPRYWDAEHTALREVQFFPIENPSGEEHAFRAGQLHVTYTLPISKVAAWREQDPARLRIDPLLKTLFVAFNAKRAPLDDSRVRRAFALAIDREALSRAALGGIYPAAYAATPPNTGGYTARAHAEYNVAEARKLLADSGHAGGAGLPALSLQVLNDETQPVVAEALQAMWQRALGVRVEVVPAEQKTWLQNQSTSNYTLSIYSWIGDYPDPITFLNLWTSTNENNWTGWSDPAYDALIAAADTIRDTGQRADKLQEAEAFLLHAAPVTPIYHGVKTFLLQPTVHGWVPAPLGIRRYQRVELAAEPTAAATH